LHGFISHLKPRESGCIPRRFAIALKAHRPQMPRDSRVFEF